MSKRLSVTLTDEEEAILDVFADSDSAEHRALRAWAERRGTRMDATMAEARFLRLLLQAGASSLREEVLQEGYAALAESMTSVDREESAAMRRRYADRTDQHMSA